MLFLQLVFTGLDQLKSSIVTAVYQCKKIRDEDSVAINLTRILDGVAKSSALMIFWSRFSLSIKAMKLNAGCFGHTVAVFRVLLDGERADGERE